MKISGGYYKWEKSLLSLIILRLGLKREKLSYQPHIGRGFIFLLFVLIQSYLPTPV
jgi:hypothetical protein